MPEIIRCPLSRLTEALAFVLRELPPSSRRDVARTLLDADDPFEIANEALYVAVRDNALCGVAWGQRQSGNIAVFWPPWLGHDEDVNTAYQLAEHVVQTLDDTSVELTQVLVTAGDPDVTRVLDHVDFRHLADLWYLSCEAARFPQSEPAFQDTRFEPFRGGERARLMHLIERTYEGTLDCKSLNGVRNVDNVVTGYQATGAYRADNWQFVQIDGIDVGVLLLADHPDAGHWELMYMGLVPEARGNGRGRDVVARAQWMAKQAGAERIVLAVDSINVPALCMYRRTGFEMWDRRSVYMRFPAKPARYAAASA